MLNLGLFFGHLEQLMLALLVQRRWNFERWRRPLIAIDLGQEPLAALADMRFVDLRHLLSLKFDLFLSDLALPAELVRLLIANVSRRVPRRRQWLIYSRLERTLGYGCDVLELSHDLPLEVVSLTLLQQSLAARLIKSLDELMVCSCLPKEVFPHWVAVVFVLLQHEFGLIVTV